MAAYIIAVNIDNLTDKRTVVCAWGKAPANNPGVAEQKAIDLALHCLFDNEFVERLQELKIRDKIVDVAIFNDNDNAVAASNRPRNMLHLCPKCQQWYGCELRIVWEPNRDHSPHSVIAIADAMAKSARINLPPGGALIMGKDLNYLGQYLADVARSIDPQPPRQRVQGRCDGQRVSASPDAMAAGPRVESHRCNRGDSCYQEASPTNQCLPSEVQQRNEDLPLDRGRHVERSLSSTGAGSSGQRLEYEKVD